MPTNKKIQRIVDELKRAEQAANENQKKILTPLITMLNNAHYQNG
jgi:hypothetical protein